MTHTLTLGAYWPARRESIDRCADRLSEFVRQLAECDKAFARWYRRDRSRRSASAREVRLRAREQVLALLDEGRNRRDIGKEVIEDLGFHIGLWNGAEPERSVALSIRCGLYSGVHGIGGNAAVLDFPESPGELADPARASTVLSIVARCWEPDWAGIFSTAAMRARDWWRQPFVDWMVYVPRRVDSVPPPSSVTVLPDGGSLIVVQPTPPAVDDPEDQERVRRVEQTLRP